MRFLTSSGCSRTSKPATVALPAVGGRKQVSMRMVVVLPAPLGPRKADDLAFCDFEGDVVDRGVPGVSLG